jgi:hypothetical protein
METVDDLSGQQYPAGSQVTSRVPGAHVAEVDHAAEIALVISFSVPATEATVASGKPGARVSLAITMHSSRLPLSGAHWADHVARHATSR